MPPRTILYTGTGGAGTTCVAAATARCCAAAGRPTLVLSADPAGALADVLGVPLGAHPVEVAPNLRAQAIRAEDELGREGATVRAWLGGVSGPAAPIVPPGIDGLVTLRAIQRHWDAGEAEVLVVDCGPLAETLRLLAFPDAARAWLRQDEHVRGGAHPELRGLIALNEVLGDHAHTSVRLVTTPDRRAAATARRAFTALRLYGYLADAVIVGRLLPDDAGAAFAAERDRQREQLAVTRTAFAPVPVLTAPRLPREVAGAALLDELGEALFAGHDPAAALHRALPQEVTVTRTGAKLRLDLPFVTAGDVSLTKTELELTVRVDGHQRTLALPPALSGYRPAGATVRDGALHVAFARATADA